MDDPNLDDGAKQSLLALLSGDSITVDVKYEPPKQIRKLPVMICSNFDLFQGELWESVYMPILLKELNPFAVREFFQSWGYMINNNTNDVLVDLYFEINMTMYTMFYWLLREAHYVALSSQSAGNEARA